MAVFEKSYLVERANSLKKVNRKLNIENLVCVHKCIHFAVFALQLSIFTSLDHDQVGT